MSVYTTIEHDELVDFLRRFSLGELIDFAGISAGIENTNYFVTTTAGEYVLTIFEELTAEELPFFLDLMAFLAEHGVPSAHPLADREGRYLQAFKGKPAALVQRLRGHNIEQPDRTQCAAIGDALGTMHRQIAGFTGRRPNPRGAAWRRDTAARVLPRLAEDEAALLRAELEFESRFRLEDLPRGVIHADLFRDNALFEGEELTGIIDFYYACEDALLYDLAVTVNDWCTTDDGGLDDARVMAMVEAYARQRPFTALEVGAWAVELRAAALRFWLSRLQDKLFPRDGAITHIKDPTHFQRILAHHVARHDHLDHVARVTPGA
ncbi:MAG TPA: homoserine kinase [Gammaproteobacteria bacterium]|nr:homoserine kinase [Gammaproteobacteria bacterium]